MSFLEEDELITVLITVSLAIGHTMGTEIEVEVVEVEMEVVDVTSENILG